MNSVVIVTMLAAVAPAAPPVAMPPPPPPVMLAPPPVPRIVERTSAVPLANLDVVITAGRETLWSGSLSVGASGANYSEALRQADDPCPGRPSQGDEGYRYVDNSRRLELGINRRGGREIPDSFTINARWTRPVAVCEGGGNRGISLDQQVDIAPGQTVRLTGDAGLVIALTRRAQ